MHYINTPVGGFYVRRIFYLTAFWLFLICFFTLTMTWMAYTIRYNRQLNREKAVYQSLQSDVLSYDNQMDHPVHDMSPKSDSVSTKKDDTAAIPDVDFKTLQKKNPDIYSWILIPGTSVSYPVLQHPTNNSYYLHHNVDGSAGYPGCIFSENTNQKDFSDSPTVLYGHNMRNGTMFGALHALDTIDFSTGSHFIYIITPDAGICYQIVTTAVTDNQNILSVCQKADNGLMHFLTRIQMHRSGKTAHALIQNTSDNARPLLILSTCGSRRQSRFLVLAIKQNEWRKPY